jgi:hypothetical protein
MINRRKFVKLTALTTLSSTIGNFQSEAQHLLMLDFMKTVKGGRTFRSVGEAQKAKAGDEVLIRDLSQIAPESTWSITRTRGKWHLRPYQLADGQKGRLLMVNDPAKDLGPSAVPSEIEWKVDLPGWYAIWIGVPTLDLRPRAGARESGVDIALDGDPAYVRVGPENGTRKGRHMGPMNVEVMCFWKCAKLNNRTLRIRVPNGTYSSRPWGLVRGTMTSLRLVKMSDAQVKSYQKDISNQATKRVIILHDGFSHYFSYGEPGTGVDARYVQKYRDSDVKMFMFQTPATGVANWPSKITNLLGEGMPEELWSKRRKGDRRAYDYIQWAVKNGQEGFRVVSQVCRQAHVQCHASMRMNLFFKNGGRSGEALEEYFNGRWWREHPELRKQAAVEGSALGIEKAVQIDYAQPQARQFVTDLLMELATNYDVEGVNLDFTRWPPIADPRRHDFSVLTTFVKEFRQKLDRLAARKGRQLALSALLVDGHHARMTLAEQKIDLEAWLASGCLNFVCVECGDRTQYLALAKRYRVPYYSIQDNGSFTFDGWSLDEKSWQAQEGRVDWDPLPEEDMEEEPNVNSSLDPTEYDRGFLNRYKLGIDGVCIVNGAGRHLRRLGHVEEMAERAVSGKVWGQEIGPKINIGS